MAIFLTIWILFSFLSPISVYPHPIKVITIDDFIIGPPVVDYIQRGIKEAEKDNAILIIELDTPGGLLSSTQKIVKLLLNSKIPVVTYITPQGAKAASAGVFISYASHILAMSPSTHIGAAHPIIGKGSWGSLPEEIKEKVMNDILAWAKNIANARKKPFGFIKEAIEKSVSITEKEAQKRKVCDIIASDIFDLLNKLEGKTVTVKNKRINLRIEKDNIITILPTTREKILISLINPNIAYLLLTLGFLGLIFEITHPGFGFPGIAGAIFLLLSFYTLNILPVNYAGIALIALGIIFFVVEAFTPTFGMFTLAGVISLSLGSLIMFNQPQVIKVSYFTFLPVIIFFSFVSLFLLSKVIISQKRKPKTGMEALVGKTGVAKTDIDRKKGKVVIGSEIWDATSSSLIKKGEEVIIEGAEGLKLIVRKKEV